ncbi:MAG TPA: SDR family oxidoreductase [Terriglobales bacterium]|nr:SDR family oxidoreductase [Terriglobales bacterium]
MNDGTPQLRDQVAVVTGGGRGIGAAISRRLASLGMKVVVCGRTRARLDQTAGAIREAGGQAEAAVCDVGRLADVEALARHVRQTHGRIDVLVNNAGVGVFSAPLHLLSPEDWERVMGTNLRGVYHTIRAFAPMMIAAKKGQIINISSGAGRNPLPNGAAYAASKWGLNGLTFSVAEELRQYNIRVAVVAPGSVNTELSPHPGKDPSKMLQPDDIAGIVQMMVTASPQSFIRDVFVTPAQRP